MSADDIVQLEGAALQRIASAKDLARVTGDMAAGLRLIPQEVADKFLPAFLLLTEVQALMIVSDVFPQEPAPEQQPDSRTVHDGNAVHCAALLRNLRYLDAGQRKQVVMERTGWSKSAFYRYRTAAIEAGLLDADL